MRDDATRGEALSAAERAELDDLRLRAYGVDADIGTDPAALDRLIELEDRARQAIVAAEPASEAGARSGSHGVTDTDHASNTPGEVDAAPPAPDAPMPPAPASTVPVAPTATVLPGASAPAPHAPRRAGFALLGVAAAAIVTAGVFAAGAEDAAVPEASAPSISAEEAVMLFPEGLGGSVLLEFPVGRSLARGGAGADPPSPVAEGLRWTLKLGNYYGWDLWIARSHLGNPCIVVARDTESDGACVIPEAFDAGDLVVSIPFVNIAEDERPPAMTATERIEYRWLPERGVVLLRAGGSITYFGPTD